ncbi:MAG: PhoX family protein [Actinomycetota bacterium]|nr:PhoX family protein [Actinomycetota bacterium]
MYLLVPLLTRALPVALLLVLILAPAAEAKPPSYLSPEGGGYSVKPLLSVGDRVPVTGDSSKRYQMVGIPDGLGVYATSDDRRALYMNHEFEFDVTSEPVVGGALNRGAYVSRFVLNDDAKVLSGARAYDRVYQENELVGPAAQTNNDTPAFGRFCSSFLALPSTTGFDRPIYFTNEEADGPETFDPKGGQSVAIFDGEAHTLPKLGFFPKENTVVMPGTGAKTVIISLEDGPTTTDSQLYMYVGTKDTSAGASVLARNGLDNGKLYVFTGSDPEIADETTFLEGSTKGTWTEIPGASKLDDVELEEAADEAGAFGFVRIEDGAFSKTDDNRFFFVTTGGAPDYENVLGRLYSLKLNSPNPLGEAALHMAYNADQVVLVGGDIAISPDNVDVSGRHLMIQEDATDTGKLVMAALERDASIWRFKLGGGGSGVDVDSARRVAEVNPPGRDGIPVPTGSWESSGITYAGSLVGGQAWLGDVQAHSPTTAPKPNTVEDGQLFLLRR